MLSTPPQEHLQALRRSFDERFAAPARAGGPKRERLVEVEAGGRNLALRCTELAAVLPCPAVVPLPRGAVELLGVAGVRGELVAVFDLARLAGLAASSEPLRWLVLIAADPWSGLAFSGLGGQIDMPAEAAMEAAGRLHRVTIQRYVGEGAEAIPVLDIPALAAELRRLGRGPAISQE